MNKLYKDLIVFAIAVQCMLWMLCAQVHAGRTYEYPAKCRGSSDPRCRELKECQEELELCQSRCDSDAANQEKKLRGLSANTEDLRQKIKELTIHLEQCEERHGPLSKEAEEAERDKNEAGRNLAALMANIEKLEKTIETQRIQCEESLTAMLKKQAELMDEIDKAKDMKESLRRELEKQGQNLNDCQTEISNQNKLLEKCNESLQTIKNICMEKVTNFTAELFQLPPLPHLYYYQNDVVVNGTNAIRLCYEKGMYLAKIESATENTLIWNHILPFPVPDTNVWIDGYRYQHVENYMVDGCGNYLTFNQFSALEPNNDVNEGGENGVVLTTDTGFPRWNDRNQTTCLAYYLCEMDDVCSDILKPILFP